MSLHLAATESLIKVGECKFVDSLSPFEFYALFNMDQSFRNWLITHAFPPSNCEHCRKLIYLRHGVACDSEFRGNPDTYLNSGQEKFREFQKVEDEELDAEV
jgi:hypothetical protein